MTTGKFNVIRIEEPDSMFAEEAKVLLGFCDQLSQSPKALDAKEKIIQAVNLLEEAFSDLR